MAATHSAAQFPLLLLSEMAEDKSVLLLTGATGLVGSALFRLLSGTSRQFILLTRDSGSLQNLDSAGYSVVMKGDITCPLLGVDQRTYDQLTHSITEIIHCAADTRFGIPL